MVKFVEWLKFHPAESEQFAAVTKAAGKAKRRWNPLEDPLVKRIIAKMNAEKQSKRACEEEDVGMEDVEQEEEDSPPLARGKQQSQRTGSKAQSAK